MGKKIALLAATWDGELVEAQIKGIKQCLDKTGYDLHVFMCFPAMDLKDPDNFGSYNIFSLSQYGEYDGFILSVNVINGVQMMETYHPYIFSMNKPVISLDQNIPNIPSVMPDGYSVMYHLVEHLIVHHKCKTLNYVGGGAEHPDNITRKKAFKDCMTAHKLPIEPKRVRDYWFTEMSGRMAYEDFKKDNLQLADAVVCANDATALGYCQAAEADGYYPPKDFLITGYDNDDNAKSFSPMITTIEKKAEKMGYEGCALLLKMMEGKDKGRNIQYNPELVYHGSCGCYSEDEMEEMDVRQVHRKMYNMKKDITHFYENLSNIRQDLALSTDEEDFVSHMNSTLGGYPMYGYAMCVNKDVYYDTKSKENEWKIGYFKEQIVVTGKNEESPFEGISLLQTKQLIPKALKVKDKTECHVYMFVPIQKRGLSIGYMIFVDAVALLQRRLLVFLTQSINNAYSNLQNVENLRRLNKWLDSVYIVDAMTGLYNRFGYMRSGYEMYEKSKMEGKPLIVMFMDMNRLKHINDTYGHSAGDTALTKFSEILKECAGEERIAIRYGGDEFMLIGPVSDAEDAEKFYAYVLDVIEKKNQKEKLPYKLEASIGYVLTDVKSKLELDDYVKKADALMYEEKKKSYLRK